MSLFRRPSRRDDPALRLRNRLVRQSASLLLAYPDEHLPDRLATVEALVGHLDEPERSRLAGTAAYLRGSSLLEAAQAYVDTFDLRRRSTMYLTYWTAGDTRNRGSEIHAFVQTYREAGAEPPIDEAPDHLPVVLEFAATVAPDAGERLLVAHRVPIDVLHRALVDDESPYADTIAAVCATLPPVDEMQEQRARQLMHAGPPAEAIGLQPFTLTVPPRRDSTTEGLHDRREGR